MLSRILPVLVPSALLLGSPAAHAARQVALFSGLVTQAEPATRERVPKPAGSPVADGLADGLAETPFKAELLSFSMRVPIGTTVRLERGASPGYLLGEESENPRWRIRASSLKASRSGTTARSQCEEYIAELRTRGQSFSVISSEPRPVDGRVGHLFYLSVPLDEDESGISGVLMVPTEPDEYLVFSIIAVDEGFDATRALLERSFDTISLADRMEVLGERADLLGRGQAIVGSFTPEALKATVSPEPLFYRMWRPDPSGRPTEVGYVIVRVREGQRGEVDASVDARSLRGVEAEKGLLATMDARVVVNQDPTHTLDVQSRYFVTWDRFSEAWSVRSTQRHRSASRSSAQTGIRTPTTPGSPRPMIRVISATRDGVTKEPQEWAVPPAYISQAELVVLGQLLPRRQALEKVEFLDYAFDQRDERLPQRRETWSRTESGWRLETRIGSSPDKLVQEFDTDGVRVRRIDPDGTVTERTTLADLRALWRSKGLPVD